MDTIWSATLDKKWLVEVTGHEDSQYRGTLTIKDGDEVVFTQEVGVSYGAMFGPDVDDVATWQTIAINYIDNL
ncbi:hypothetical protein QEH42_gp256 [Microbacterium phage Pumpernickel]|uniref:Uncharacterized protein n=1 Tax=Microbacterium phage Pumpernickel TaxID=2885983 RepID=A0AAE9C2X3_9CAUD|nr:hypothetical protein QEH42_gp256 [Microbacterium phage Pumpernickel]UDL15962.1 hypothetical protein SEA_PUMPERNICKEL_212 [Microbacterium phage Pumpernickel]